MLKILNKIYLFLLLQFFKKKKKLKIQNNLFSLFIHNNFFNNFLNNLFWNFTPFFEINQKINFNINLFSFSLNKKIDFIFFFKKNINKKLLFFIRNLNLPIFNIYKNYYIDYFFKNSFFHLNFNYFLYFIIIQIYLNTLKIKKYYIKYYYKNIQFNNLFLLYKLNVN